jgi:5-methylcytosine-specific restriction protein A
VNDEDVWLRVREFAGRCLSTGTPVQTLSRGVTNYITDVRDGSIGRRSDEGRTNVSRVARGEVAKLWAELHGGEPAQVLFFTRALVAAALPDLVQVIDGDIRLRTSSRAAFVLTWNPARWPWQDLDAALDRSLRGQPVEYRWSTGNTNRIAPGDRLFLLKQGALPRGIMGSGFAAGPVFEDEHYLPERAAGGDKALFVQARFDRLVEPEAVLAVDELAEGPLSEVHWAMPASGFQLPPTAAGALEEAWSQHLPHRSASAGPDELTPGKRYPEGTAFTVTVNRYERDPRARAACIAHWGTSCAVCSFSFGDAYGQLGDGYIHVHHLNPLASGAGSRDVDPVADLRPVCPNCHAMLHRQEPPLSIEELREQLRPSTAG